MSVLLLFNPTPPTDIYTLSLHDALPILPPAARPSLAREHPGAEECLGTGTAPVSGRRAERGRAPAVGASRRSEEHTSELQSHSDLVCRLLLEKKKKNKRNNTGAKRLLT